MKHWYTAQTLAGLPGMPKTQSGVIRFAKRKTLPFRKHAGRGGGREYDPASLPLETQAALRGDKPAPRAKTRREVVIRLDCDKIARSRSLIVRGLARLLRAVILEALRKEAS